MRKIGVGNGSIRALSRVDVGHFLGTVVFVLSAGKVLASSQGNVNLDTSLEQHRHTRLLEPRHHMRPSP